MGREWIMVLDTKPRMVVEFWGAEEANDFMALKAGEGEVNNGLIWGDPDRAAYLYILAQEPGTQYSDDAENPHLPDMIIIWNACMHSCWFDNESWKKLIARVREESKITGTPVEWFEVKS